MKILFIGSVIFSKKVLEKLITLNCNITGVCTLKESSFNSDHIDLAPFCEKNNILVKYTENINSLENLKWIKTMKPDIIFCFGWSRLLSQSLLNIPPMGVLGFHPAALPANRGRHPLIWAIILGLNETASTFFFMDDKADSGDIISQHQIKISKNEDAGTLYNKVVKVALEQIEDFIPKLISGDYKRIKQNHKLANTWRKRNKSDGKIDWRMSAQDIHSTVKALTKPYVGAHLEFAGIFFKVWETEIVFSKKQNIEPGKVIQITDGKIIIKAGKDAILLKKTEPILEAQIGNYL